MALKKSGKRFWGKEHINTDSPKGSDWVFDPSGAFWMTLALAAVARLCGGFYYDLNDDVLIKDILAGVYTGRPEAHTMQILYPLGLLLSLLYYIPGLPVFGLFLCLCQFGSVFAIAYRTLTCLSSKKRKIVALTVMFLFWIGACLEHLVFLQYTVTAGMLGAAAIFWMVTSDRKSTAKGFLKENLPALILYWLCFCLRSEMGMLLFPLAGAAGFCKWFSGSHPLHRENLTRYLGLFGALLTGICLFLGADWLAYRTPDWQEFGRFFDARTTVYDYQRDVVENYKENKEIYEALGMSETEQQLLKNYNFGADDQIDAGCMEQLAALASERENGGLFRKSLRTGLWELVFGHFLSETDFCMNAAVVFLGVLLFVPGFFVEKKHRLWMTPLLTACGCALWMFIILRDRMLTRISTPLYLGMMSAFAGLLLAQIQTPGGREETWSRWLGDWAVKAAAFGLVLTSLLIIPGSVTDVTAQAAVRKETNQVNEMVLEYCSQSPEVLYLEDVYSTVSFSEKIGVDRKKPFNYDLLGGWLVKSPLTDRKLAAFGLESMGLAVSGSGQVRLLSEAQSDLTWLENFWTEQGVDVKAVLEESIAGGAVNVWRIDVK